MSHPGSVACTGRSGIHNDVRVLGCGDRVVADDRNRPKDHKESDAGETQCWLNGLPGATSHPRKKTRSLRLRLSFSSSPHASSPQTLAGPRSDTSITYSHSEWPHSRSTAVHQSGSKLFSESRQTLARRQPASVRKDPSASSRYCFFMRGKRLWGCDCSAPSSSRGT